MVAHNNELPNQHFRKEWDRRVKTWLDQPARKLRRRNARKAKAAAVAPRPVDKLRPSVRGQSARYNAKAKQGRGFSLAEVRGAGLTPQAAQTLGVAVDHRRINKSEESLATNVARLRAYLSTVVVTQKQGKAPKIAGGLVKAASVSAVRNMGQAAAPAAPARAAAAKAKPAVEFVAVTAAMKEATAFRTLRQEWINMRLKGKRDRVAKEKADAAAKAGDKKPEE